MSQHFFIMVFSYLKHNISFMDVSIPRSKALRGDVLHKNVTGQSESVLCFEVGRKHPSIISHQYLYHVTYQLLFFLTRKSSCLSLVQVNVNFKYYSHPLLTIVFCPPSVLRDLTRVTFDGLSGADEVCDLRSERGETLLSREAL